MIEHSFFSVNDYVPTLTMRVFVHFFPHKANVILIISIDCAYCKLNEVINWNYRYNLKALIHGEWIPILICNLAQQLAIKAES